MSKFDPLEYWESRHSELTGDHRNVGNRGLSSEQNWDLIVTKSVIVAHTLGAYDVPREVRILDAGCGAGAFTEILQMSGFKMTGIDGSPSAIESARASGRAEYQVAPLSSIRAPTAFDVVLCLDVLFHVVDDEEWQRSISALCAAVSDAGKLIIVETFGREGIAAPQHVRWRSRHNYDAALQDRDFEIVGDVQFQYPHEGADKTLLVCGRK